MADCETDANRASRQDEFRALRETIRERGTTRFWIFVATLGIWGGLATATTMLGAAPVATCLPLLILAGGFEAIYGLHTGVERIGRYLQVYHEPDAGSAEAGPAWEHVAMALGRRGSATAPDPLFTYHFAAGTLLNAFPVLWLDPIPVEVAIVGLAHVLFLGRIVVARRHGTRRRVSDLEQFEQLKASGRRSG